MVRNRSESSRGGIESCQRGDPSLCSIDLAQRGRAPVKRMRPVGAATGPVPYLQVFAKTVRLKRSRSRVSIAALRTSTEHERASGRIHQVDETVAIKAGFPKGHKYRLFGQLTRRCQSSGGTRLRAGGPRGSGALPYEE
eukprot:scaffold1919_cov394-Prasinococcus_capsulatus_cf.AAC.13